MYENKYVLYTCFFIFLSKLYLIIILCISLPTVSFDELSFCIYLLLLFFFIIIIIMYDYIINIITCVFGWK